MPHIQLHYDGWVALPESARQHLHVAKGDRLEVELTEGGLLLRPAQSTASVDRTAPVSQQQPEAAAPSSAEPPAAKRGPGRPRKMAVQGLLPARIGGRRKMVPAI
jgi:antitoxin component of MazEF toxin-antitoxin module